MTWCRVQENRRENGCFLIWISYSKNTDLFLIYLRTIWSWRWSPDMAYLQKGLTLWNISVSDVIFPMDAVQSAEEISRAMPLCVVLLMACCSWENSLFLQKELLYGCPFVWWKMQSAKCIGVLKRVLNSYLMLGHTVQYWKSLMDRKDCVKYHIVV